jgi:hypothetical protein
MRTTITIHDDLLEEAKNVAHQRNCTLGKVIEEALQLSFAKQKQLEPEVPVKFPTFGGKGVLPGVNLDSTADLLDAMEGA